MTANDRDTLQEVVFAAMGGTSYEITDRILASDWLAQERRRVAAQTLRDAADALGGSVPHWMPLWLRDRADTTACKRAGRKGGTHHD